MNIVDKFLYRLMVGFILLLSVVLLDKYQIVEYDYLKSECSEHFNALNLINKLNCGKIACDRYDLCFENLKNKVNELKINIYDKEIYSK